MNSMCCPEILFVLINTADHVGLSLAGEKLIDHLKKWLEPEKLLVANKLWENSQDSEIAIAILELFHLLPSQAAKYLETSQVLLKPKGWV